METIAVMFFAFFTFLLLAVAYKGVVDAIYAKRVRRPFYAGRLAHPLWRPVTGSLASCQACDTIDAYWRRWYAQRDAYLATSWRD